MTYTDTGEKDGDDFILECDKTALEILAAYTSGKTIIARVRVSFEEGHFQDKLLTLTEINYAGGLDIFYADFAYLPNSVGIVEHFYDQIEGTETITESEQNFG